MIITFTYPEDKSKGKLTIQSKVSFCNILNEFEVTHLDVYVGNVRVTDYIDDYYDDLFVEIALNKAEEKRKELLYAEKFNR